MAKITADTLIADCLQLNPDAPDILMAAGGKRICLPTLKEKKKSI